MKAQDKYTELKQEIDGLKNLWNKDIERLNARISVLENWIPTRRLIKELLEDIMTEAGRDYIEQYSKRVGAIRAVREELKRVSEAEDRLIRILGVAESTIEQAEKDNDEKTEE